eukprot:jgi/Orpsp1_1/1190394/evm.model.d7180000078706.1
MDFVRKYCNYMIYGKEGCPKTGNPHLQGYLILEKLQEMVWIKNRIFSSIHLELSNRSAVANIIYCEKENEYTTFLQQLYLEDGCESHFHNHFVWLTGATGVGKSYRARLILEKIKLFYADFKKKNPLTDVPGFIAELYDKLKNKWWDHHKLQSVVLLEEIDPESGKYLAQPLKVYCDQYPFPVEVKQGSFRFIRPYFFIITSNYTMAECFPDPKDLLPLKRRIKEIVIKDREQKIRWPNFELNRE